MATLVGDGTSPNTILPALECTIICHIIWRLLTETPLQALLPDGAAKGGGLVAAGYGHDSRTVALGGSTAYPVKILVLGVMEGNNEYSGGTDRGLYYEDGRVDPDLEKTDGINECWLKVTSGGSSKYYYLNHGDGLSPWDYEFSISLSADATFELVFDSVDSLQTASAGFVATHAVGLAQPYAGQFCQVYIRPTLPNARP